MDQHIEPDNSVSDSTKQYATLEIAENNDDNTQSDMIKIGGYQNQPITRKWIILHFIILILSITLVIVSFIIPLTGSFLLYNMILLFISIDAIITIFACKNGVCCKSKFKKMNQTDGCCTLLTTIFWVLALFITIICAMSDTLSPYTSYNRWEEFIPILIAILIEILLCRKLWIRYSSNILPIVYNTNYDNYHSEILSNSQCCTHFCIPCKWVFLIFFIFLSCTLSIHSIEKSFFINSFNVRNTKLLTTEHFGSFEYECIGSTEPQNANIRIITVTGLGTIHLEFGWYNNLIYNQYGNKNISICNYNRGGMGFTETKKYKDKLIKTDVEHLMEIADVLYGKNKSFHLMGHSRGGLMLLQSKMLYNDRIESMVFFDGSSNVNKIQHNATHNYQFDDYSALNIIYSIFIPMMTFGMTSNIFVGATGVSGYDNFYEAQLNGKYYGFRNYQFQTSVWEENDFQIGYENTMKLYNNNNNNKSNYNFGNVLNIDCEFGYVPNPNNKDENIWYSSINNTLYAKATHNACAMDKDVANKIFYFNNTGLKVFYDALFI